LPEAFSGLEEGFDVSETVSYTLCPRFKRCSVNHCPLDPDQDKREAVDGDAEQRCGLPKRRRAEIAQAFPALLPLRGLTRTEAGHRNRWERMAPEKRTAFLASQQRWTPPQAGVWGGSSSQSERGPLSEGESSPPVPSDSDREDEREAKPWA
jgi:hypothetical protein